MGWIKFRQSGEEGIEEIQGEVFVALFYLVYFILGVAAGHYLVKPVTNLIVGFL